MENLRLYTFNNFYLSAMQQGIQSAHLVGDLFIKYNATSAARSVLHRWARDHKTMIVLNGGANQDINEIFADLREITKNEMLPVGCFHEDEASLGGIMTCCGIVVPESLYAAVDHAKASALLQGCESQYPMSDIDPATYFYINDDDVEFFSPGTPRHQLIELIKSCRLAG